MMIGKVGEFLNAIYPDLCIACDERHPVEGSCFCVHCLADLPFTNFHKQPDNMVEMYFWGRLIVERATAMLLFQKGELVQDMLHRFKYKNEKFIGKGLGFHFGSTLQDSGFLKDIDLIIPIPIHKAKRRIRDYNQSAVIAAEMTRVSGIPHTDKALEKYAKTESQTNKTREERMRNLLHTFRVKDPEAIRDKHILLVDDILTTGATLEAAGSLLKDFNCKISIAVLAVGKY